MALEAEVPGSMTPACTGPTATSCTSSPSTLKKSVTPHSPGRAAREPRRGAGLKRMGFSHG